MLSGNDSGSGSPGSGSGPRRGSEPRSDYGSGSGPGSGNSGQGSSNATSSPKLIQIKKFQHLRQSYAASEAFDLSEMGDNDDTSDILTFGKNDRFIVQESTVRKSWGYAANLTTGQEGWVPMDRLKESKRQIEFVGDDSGSAPLQSDIAWDYKHLKADSVKVEQILQGQPEGKKIRKNMVP